MSVHKEKPLIEEQLLQRFRNGDQEAFAGIYTRYAADLIDFVSAKLASMEEARDLIHDLFVEFWEKREQLHIGSSLRSYLFAAARYRVIDHIRRNIRREYYTGITGQARAGGDNSTSNEILYKDLSEIMDAEIEKLPPRTREIFRLSRYQHLSVNEIARKLSLSDQTVKNQLTSALRKLRPGFEKLAAFFLFFL